MVQLVAMELNNSTLFQSFICNAAAAEIYRETQYVGA